MDNSTDPSSPPQKTPSNRFRMSLERVPVIIILVTLLATAVVHFSWRYVSHQSIVGMTQQLNVAVASNIIREIDVLLGNASSNLGTTTSNRGRYKFCVVEVFCNSIALSSSTDDLSVLPPWQESAQSIFLAHQ